jgi:hypothetical protein
MWRVGGYFFREETLQDWITNDPKAPKQDRAYGGWDLPDIMNQWMQDTNAPDCIFAYGLDVQIDGRPEWRILLAVQQCDDPEAPLRLTQFPHLFERTEEVENWLNAHCLPASEANFGTVLDPCIRKREMEAIAGKLLLQQQAQAAPVITAA